MLSSRVLSGIMVVVAVAMAVYHLVSTQFLFVRAIEHANIHLAFSLVLVFLTTMQKVKNTRVRLLLLTLIVLSLLGTGYIHLFNEEIEDRPGFPTVPDLTVGVVLIIIVIEASREPFGLIFPIMCVVFILYAFLGPYLPEPFRSMRVEWYKIVSRLSSGLDGIYGGLLSISANYIFMFIIFGALLQTSAATGFFIQLGKLASRMTRAGPAMAAVIGSALVGMVTGSVSANVATVGSFTIPMMKRAGYRPEHAAAIEATASTGGQIMPPVMGAGAFLMVGITGIPYTRIMLAAAIPALLYFFTAGLYAQFRAAQLNLARSEEEVDFREMLLCAPLFFVPLTLLVVFLAQGHSLPWSIFWTIAALMSLVMVRKKTRGTLKGWIKGIVQGAVTGAQIAASCAAIGLVVKSMEMTGMAVKMPAAVEAWSGGNLFVALTITMLISILLGTGLPTTPIYVLVAVSTAPVLVRMGVPLLAAHLFVFYYACLSFVTPPVAPGALIAAQIAGGDWVKSANEACKAALAGICVPYLFLISPILLLVPQPPLSAAMEVTAAVLICTCLQIVVCNHYLTALHALERVAHGLAAAVAVTFLITKQPLHFVFAVAPFLLLTAWQVKKKRSIFRGVVT